MCVFGGELPLCWGTTRGRMGCTQSSTITHHPRDLLHRGLLPRRRRHFVYVHLFYVLLSNPTTTYKAKYISCQCSTLLLRKCRKAALFCIHIFRTFMEAILFCCNIIEITKYNEIVKLWLCNHSQHLLLDGRRAETAHGSATLSHVTCTYHPFL